MPRRSSPPMSRPSPATTMKTTNVVSPNKPKSMKMSISYSFETVKDKTATATATANATDTSTDTATEDAFGGGVEVRLEHGSSSASGSPACAMDTTTTTNNANARSPLRREVNMNMDGDAPRTPRSGGSTVELLEMAAAALGRLTMTPCSPTYGVDDVDPNKNSNMHSSAGAYPLAAPEDATVAHQKETPRPLNEQQQPQQQPITHVESSTSSSSLQKNHRVPLHEETGNHNNSVNENHNSHHDNATTPSHMPRNKIRMEASNSKHNNKTTRTGSSCVSPGGTSPSFSKMAENKHIQSAWKILTDLEASMSPRNSSNTTSSSSTTKNVSQMEGVNDTDGSVVPPSVNRIPSSKSSPSTVLEEDDTSIASYMKNLFTVGGISHADSCSPLHWQQNNGGLDRTNSEDTESVALRSMASPPTPPLNKSSSLEDGLHCNNNDDDEEDKLSTAEEVEIISHKPLNGLIVTPIPSCLSDQTHNNLTNSGGIMVSPIDHTMVRPDSPPMRRKSASQNNENDTDAPDLSDPLRRATSPSQPSASPLLEVSSFPGFHPTNRQEQQQQQPNDNLESSVLPEKTSVRLRDILNSVSSSIEPTGAKPRVPVSDHMPRWVQQVSEPSTNTVSQTDVDTDMEDDETEDGLYRMGTSKSLIVHHIVRGNWTWATAWSPDGDRLAIATENHTLAIVDTTVSTVWKVKHDGLMTNRFRTDTTHAIRSIAWGQKYIAIGGTGDAVSLLAPKEPYHVLYIIKKTGFVGSLSWHIDSTVLAIGSREDQCLIADIKEEKIPLEDPDSNSQGQSPHPSQTQITCSIAYILDRPDWVNAVAFSPGGTILAVGDRTGVLSVYIYIHMEGAAPVLSRIKDIPLKDSVLSIEWSPDGNFVYAGGEDFAITVICTSTWEIQNCMYQDRWVHFIACSSSGSHVAVGGPGRVSILDVANDCNIATSIEFGGLNPLSAKWHPKDRFLAMAGQANSIIAVEAFNDRYMKGRFLKSESPILCADFSPNGSKIVVGNEDGVVSFFDISGPNFLILYEMVLDVGGVKSVRWSPDDKYVVVGGADTLVIVSTGRGRKKISSVPTSASGFSIRKVIRGMMDIHHIGIDYDCGTVAVCGDSVRMLDTMNKFRCVLEIKSEVILATAWSRDGTLFASIGRGHDLTIYDTSSWRKMFTLSCVQAGLALAWGPTVTKGLQYLAYGGESKKVRIIEIRTQEESWEQVLSVPRNGAVNDLDWNLDGMLAVAVGDGTATVLDLAYLQCGQAVNQMDYRWQRQGIVCFTEIRRKNNSMQTVRWMPPIGSFLALGGTDGIIEMIDLTDRNQCKAYEMNVDEKNSCDPEANTLKENRSDKR